MIDARLITLALKGCWHGSYGTARCPAHEDQHPSLSLKNGSDGKFLARCHTGCDFQAILAALQSHGLLDGSSSSVLVNPQRFAQIREAERAGAAKREAQARTCWAETLRISGTRAEVYLRDCRKIACPLPPTLRYHPACWHPIGIRLPAMVALVEGAKGFAIHRTYLRPDGSDKADVQPNKAMLGSVAGGAVRLAAGPRGYEPGLTVTEGIETGLSLACGLLTAPVAIWAALSTSGLPNLRLPSWPGRLIIASDGDLAGRKAAHALAERASQLGWQVSLLPAPDGQDWNDVLHPQPSAEPTL